ncbi:putative Lung seven transmembrane receptor [Medicago truncatula]|uniref:Lung seven transmembrane receptor, putative n=1 Tax=Medicago truncatula TaxID=3880 RepID=G7IA55_MEDTR|nr:lung seven transmembrane receptor, putative [Medicago truncatula]RHN79661.1 putative Lung seven transmembrane receptor [Medicago truncatula]
MCGCVVVFTTQYCIRFLKKVANSRDGNNKALGLKLNIFKNFYVLLVLYLVFIRSLDFVLNHITKYRFRWVSSLTYEMLNIIFYLVVFYTFVPNDEKNPYFILEEEAEQSVAGTELEERSFERLKKSGISSAMQALDFHLARTCFIQILLQLGLLSFEYISKT